MVLCHRVRKHFEISLSCDSGVETLHCLEFDVIVLKCTTVEVQYIKNWGTVRLAAITDWTISKCFLAGRVLCWGKEKKNQRSNFYNSVFLISASLAIHSVVCLCLLCLVFNMYPHKHTVCLCWAEWGPPALFLFHRAYFTSPLPLRVPRQQPLLVYLCVFALWFSSEQHSPSPSGDWLSGFFIQSSMKQRLAFVWACSVCIFLETRHFSLHV